MADFKGTRGGKWAEKYLCRRFKWKPRPNRKETAGSQKAGDEDYW